MIKKTSKQISISLMLIQVLAIIISPLMAYSQFSFSENAVLPQTGWPNVKQRISEAKPIKIAYLGGSITNAKDGWRSQTLSGLQKHFPGILFSQVSAGVSGTGSDLGVFRIDKDVLAFNPDLVLIEFAVNDNGKNTMLIKESIEGIITKIKQKNSNTDIGLVYTMERSMMDYIQKNQNSPSIEAVEEVAVYYGVPSIFLPDKVMTLYREAKLVFSGDQPCKGDTMVFSKDNVHPYPETGHRLYASTFMEAVPVIFDQSAKKEEGEKLLTGNPFRQAQLVPLVKPFYNTQWQLLATPNGTVAKKFANRFDSVLYNGSKDAVFDFTFEGSRFGFYELIGPGSSAYNINIDGKDSTIIRFDRYCTNWRANYFIMPEILPGIHHVTVKISPVAIDKEKILRRSFTDAEKELFSSTAFYTGRNFTVREAHIYK